VVGGVCIDTGTIPSKTLREAVVTFSGLAGKGDRLPWARVDARPTCQQLLAGVDTVITREIEVIQRRAVPHLDAAHLRGRRRAPPGGPPAARDPLHRHRRHRAGPRGPGGAGLGGGLDYFLRTVFNYPTLAECYKVAALDASNKLRF
jgi:hypothetical protein